MFMTLLWQISIGLTVTLLNNGHKHRNEQSVLSFSPFFL